MNISGGTRLGPYDVLARLGAGGMGEVYRARDTRLDRSVALKVLPEEFFEDRDRVARFEREAKALAALNHHGIAAVHSFEELDGRHILVMELVEGEGLDGRIARGAVPLEEALPVALQIATALGAAHDRGIIHRDLKPANVMVGPDGKVKLLDFGLAKIFEADAASGSAPQLTQSPTMTGRATAAGMILGTAAYMSPEQARGKPADKRADIWAFGAVVYEMLTGRRAFEGESVSDMLAAVLKTDPDWSALPEETPANVRKVLRRCLERDRDRRFHDIADARIEIETPSDSPAISSRPAAKERIDRLSWLWIGGAAIAAFLIGQQVHFGRRPQAAPARRVVSSLVAPDGWYLDPLSGPLALSPDGTRVVFPVHDIEGHVILAARALDQPAVQLLAGTEGARNPFWSPDGRWIGFATMLTGLSRIPANGGAVESIAAIGPGRGATWNRDGVILYSPSLLSPIYRVTANKERVAITAIDATRGESVHQYPEFLPDGKHFLYVVQRVDPTTRRSESELVVQALESKERKLLLRAGSRTLYAPPGYLLYVWNGDLLAHPFDAEKLELRGDPQVVARHVQYLADASTGIFSVSQEGLLAYAEGGTIGLSQLTVFDRMGKALGNAAPAGNFWTPRISPDGRRVAAEVIDPVSANRDIWIFDANGREAPARITFDPGEDFTPVFSRDGKRIAYASYRKGFWSINQKILGSSEEERPIVTAQPAGSSAFEPAQNFALPGSKFLTDWSPDGRFIAFNGSNLKTEDDMWLLDVEAQSAKLLLSTPSSERDTAFSPDGRWIAYISSETGRPEIYVAAFPGPGGRRQASTAGGRQPKWRADGKELFFLDLGGQLMAVPVRMDGGFETGTPQPLFRTSSRRTNIPQYDIFPDGQRFLVNTIVSEKASTPATMVQNWAPEKK
jgi:eukaryotic-like serine/threonine-protein kinase